MARFRTDYSNTLSGFGVLGVVLLFLSAGGLFVGAFLGWIFNIAAFMNCDFEPSYKAEIIRGIGIPIPIVGSIAGYCEIEDGPSPTGK